MLGLAEKIKNIVVEAHNIVELKFPGEGMQLDYVAIFTQSNDEYDFYCQEADQVGSVVLEQENGITFKINPIITIDGEVTFLKVRKPDGKKEVVGAADYRVTNYEMFKGMHNELDIKTSADGVEILEVFDSERPEVLVYIPSRPFSEDYSGDKISQKTETSISDLVEEEKRKRIELMSDFQNYKKRVEQEKALFGAMANMGIIQDVLEVFDDINLALNDQDLNLEHAKDSMKSAQDKLVATAEKAGIERVSVNAGDEFDKDKMEAISAIPVQDGSQKGKVVAVISSAFKYKGKDGILKAAKVIVGK